MQCGAQRRLSLIVFAGAAEKMAVAHKPGLEGAALDDAKAAVKKIPHLVADRAGVEVIRLEA